MTLSYASLAEIVKFNDGIYYTKIHGDLYLSLFIMDNRSGEANSPNYWVQYFNAHLNLAQKHERSNDERLSGKSDVFRGMFDPSRRCQNILRESQQLYPTGIVIATKSAPILNKTVIPTLRKEIEMSMCASTSIDAPFQLHMGISRDALNYGKYLTNEGGVYHRNLSLLLHEFAAKVTLDHFDKNKAYVITTPMKSMEDIFVKNLPKESYWICGSRDSSVPNTQRCPLEQEGTVQESASLEWNLRKPAFFSENFRFIIKEDKKIILDIDKQTAETKYRWFFDNIQWKGVGYYFVADLKDLAKLFPEEK